MKKTFALVAVLLISFQSYAMTETTLGNVVAVERNFGKINLADCEAVLVQNGDHFKCVVELTTPVTTDYEIKKYFDKTSSTDDSTLLTISGVTGYTIVLYKKAYSKATFASNNKEAIDLMKTHLADSGIDQEDVVTVYHTVK